VLDQDLVAALLAIAARSDIAQRVLAILEPRTGPTSAVSGRPGR
jgi:hypothetical protein